MCISPGDSHVKDKKAVYTEGLESALDIARRLGKTGIVATGKHDNPLVISVTDPKVLIVDQSRQQDMHTFTNSKIKLLFVVGDDKGRSRADLNDLDANIHDYRERQLSFVTHITTKQTLMPLFEMNKDDTTYFPQNTKRKLNYMLGGQNVESQALSSLHKELMSGKNSQT